MKILVDLFKYITVIHLNALISIKYFFAYNIWILIALIGWGYLGYLKLKLVEKRTLKPERKRY